MWLLHLLPTSLILWIVYILLAVGAAGILASFFIRAIPFLNIYRTPIQIVSIILFCSGVYWYGGYTTEMIWRDEVAKLEEKVKESEAKSAKVNTVIKTVYRDRVKTITRDRVVVQDRIIREKELIDKDCRVSPAAISILNQAAKPRQGTVEVGPLEPVKEDSK